MGPHWDPVRATALVLLWAGSPGPWRLQEPGFRGHLQLCTQTGHQNGTATALGLLARMLLEPFELLPPLPVK